MPTFRKATSEDVEQIAEIYDEIHTENEAGRMSTDWVRGVYPTRETASASIQAGDMFVEEDYGQIVAAAKINQEQVKEYEDASWQYDVPKEQVMVIHTLVVSPKMKGKGYGSRFVAFYERYALEHGCPYLRMDTSVKNLGARALYKKLGYREVSVVSSVFNGISDMQLVCLEKKADLSPVSKFISLVLRHKPETIGISLDEHGWANVEELIDGINKTRYFDMWMLEEIVRTDKKQRYSFNEDMALIRANQGHSIPVDVELTPAEPPEYLYHGTGQKYVEKI